jgi:hypothetical protein
VGLESEGHGQITMKKEKGHNPMWRWTALLIRESIVSFAKEGRKKKKTVQCGKVIKKASRKRKA